MDEIIVVDSEYQDASHNYKKAAFKVEDASKYFTKTVLSIVRNRVLMGEAAMNVAAFIGEMNTALGSTFEGLTNSVAKLCTDYVSAIDEADRELYSGSKPPSRIYSPDIPYPSVLPITGALVGLDKAALESHISKLKSGPVKDIADNITRIGAIDFGGSKGLTKDQSVIFKDNALESLTALQEIFDAMISYLEGVAETLADTDQQVMRSVNRVGLGPAPLFKPSPVYVTKEP